jgi:predicted metal-binding membrane protein
VARWRDGLGGAFCTSVENGLWCCARCRVGLMAVVLAVMMMSRWWMGLVAAAIFVERRAYAWAI